LKQFIFELDEANEASMQALEFLKETDGHPATVLETEISYTNDGTKYRILIVISGENATFSGMHGVLSQFMPRSEPPDIKDSYELR